MNQLNQIMEAYLSDPFGDHAIMIDGPWGAGKTHYWQNVAVRLIGEAGGEGKNNRRVAYVSLFGVTSPKDLDLAIFLSLYPTVAGVPTRLVVAGVTVLSGALLRKFTGVNIADMKAGAENWLNVRDTVICFDDVERCGMPLGQALGQINDYIERGGARVVLICNESRVPDDQKVAYLKYKEKVVGQTVKFRLDPGTVLESLLEGLAATDGECVDFMRRESRAIVDLFKRSKSENIREVRRGIAAFRRIFPGFSKAGDTRDELLGRALAATFAVVFAEAGFARGDEPNGAAAPGGDGGARPVQGEGRVGEPNSADAVAKSLYGLADGWYYYRFMLGIENERTPATDLLNKYLDGRFGAGLWLEPVISNVLEGFADLEKLESEVDNLIRSPGEAETALGLIRGAPQDSEDGHLQEAWETLRSTPSKLPIESIRELHRVSQTMCLLAREGLIAATSEELYDFATQAADRLGHDEMFASEQQTPGNEEDEKLRTLLDKINLKKGLQEAKKRCSEWLNRLRQSPSKEIIDQLRGPELVSVPVFEYCDPGEVAKAIVGLSNKLKNSLLAAIKFRFECIQPGTGTPAEAKNIGEIIEELRRVAGADTGPPRKMSTWIISKQLVPALESARAKMAPRVGGAAAGAASAEDSVDSPSGLEDGRL